MPGVQRLGGSKLPVISLVRGWLGMGGAAAHRGVGVLRRVKPTFPQADLIIEAKAVTVVCLW